MPKKKRNHGETNLSCRNLIETLNDILQVLNHELPQHEQFMPVTTPKALYALRQKVKTLSPMKGTVSKDHKESGQKVEVVPKSDIQAALSTIATNAWRARNKMVISENGEAREEMKRVYRHIEAVFDTLNQIGIEVRDMQGRAYDSGMALKVISFEPKPGLSKEQIIETIKPTVTWQGRLIQIGEIIVGTPQAK